ncbi:MAG: HD domain-containing protein [Spirochaetales bacterium]|nr:HD domain-containing protein [Spirochaetales bacterium]
MSRAVKSFLIQEMKKPSGYLVALGIGSILTFAKHWPQVSMYLPFVIPFLVSVTTRTVSRAMNANSEMLLSLPRFRKDPAFIMDRDGTILLSAGETHDFFTKSGIVRLEDFIQSEKDIPVVECLFSSENKDEERPYFSSVTNSWYRAQVREDPLCETWLVWLDDVTLQVQADLRKKALDVFFHALRHDFLTLKTTRYDDFYLARLILEEGFEGVMIVRFDPNRTKDPRGSLYFARGLVASDILIPQGSNAPILQSFRLGKGIWDDRKKWDSQEGFDRAYPVLPLVRDFLGRPMENFVNYHRNDVSIIGFNKSGSLGREDVRLLETVADTAVLIFSMADLAIAADQRFIQSIHGICAAAEYSDELTGAHVWRVNRYAQILARALGFDEKWVEDIGTVAALHDIGKVAIPHLIKLQRVLDETERREMQMHPIYGAQIIRRMQESTSESDSRLEMAYSIALHHHQHWNGTGYPGILDREGKICSLDSKESSYYEGLIPLAQEAIPVEALIVSAADKYDALRSARQYKQAYSHEETLAILTKDDRSGLSGIDLFGPRVWQALLEVEKEFNAQSSQP